MDRLHLRNPRLYQFKHQGTQNDNREVQEQGDKIYFLAGTMVLVPFSLREIIVRLCSTLFCTALFTAACVTLAGQAQPPSTPAKSENSAADINLALKATFEAKIKAEWEALKNKDKKAYGDLLADDYQGVETDGQGERNKLQAIEEVSATNVANYTLWGLKVTPLDPNATFIVYEVTMQFPPGSAIRFSRVYISALWVRKAGEWKELHYQETHVK